MTITMTIGMFSLPCVNIPWICSLNSFRVAHSMDWDWEDGHHPHMFLLVPLFVALLGCCFARKARRRCRRQRMMRDGVLVEEDRGRCCRRRCSRRRVDSGADYPGATPAPPARGMVIGQPVQLVNPPAESENPEEVAYFPSAPGNDTQRLVAH